MQQSRNAQLKNGPNYNSYGIHQQPNPLSQQHNFNYNHHSDLQRVTVTPRDTYKDPLAIAERGKVGVPPSSHSECSSNDSVEASIDSHTGILNGERKGNLVEESRSRGVIRKLTFCFLFTERIHIVGAPKSADSSVSSTCRLDGNKSGKYQKVLATTNRQSSLDDVPDIESTNNNNTNILSNLINNNNEDVSAIICTIQK